MSLYDRAAVIPGRSMTCSKAPDRLRKAWAKSAHGAIVVDTDGRAYLDMVCSLGAISLGYSDDRHSSLRWGPRGVYSLPHVLEIEAAEAILTHVAPWATHVKTTKTGSEATHAAYRVAKAATGRPHVIAMEGAYHGWHEWSALGSECERFGPCADLWALNTDPREIAAVFIEPPRFAPLNVAWLEYVRKFCTEAGALMVMDEMIYGGRWALGGATEYFGVTPDLATFGKACANGEAAAFVVGRDALAAHGEVASGTFSGDATGLQAIVDTLGTYATEPVIDTLWQRARTLHALFSAFVPASFCTLTGPAPLMGLQFANPEHKAPFRHAMHERGILCNDQWLMTMYAHTPEHMERVAIAAGEACRAVT